MSELPTPAPPLRITHPLPATVRLATGGEYALPPDGRWHLPGVENAITTDLFDRPFVDPKRQARVPDPAQSPSRTGTDRPTSTWYADLVEGERRESRLHPDLAHALRLYLAGLVGRRAPDTLRLRVSAAVHFECWLPLSPRGESGPHSFAITDFTPVIFDAYRRYCHEHLRSKGAYPAALRAFYAWGVSQELPGYAAPTLKLLKRLALKGGVRAEAVRLRDPRRGAFSRLEQELIAVRIDAKAGPATGRACADILRQTGVRTRVLPRLRAGDLIEHPPGSVTRFQLRLPRHKQPGAAGQDVRARPPAAISEALGLLLLSLHTTPGGRRPPDATPLIPDLHVRRDGTARKHKTAAVRWELRYWATRAGLWTDRVPPAAATAEELARGGPYRLTRLDVTPRRFRRTMATTLAEQGHPPEVIAAMLDDRTLAMATVYVENTPVMVDLLADTLDRYPEWHRKLRLFTGRVGEPEDDYFPPLWGGAWWLPNAADFEDVGMIGRCAAPAPCDLRPPLSCYRCRHFRASRDVAVHARQRAQVREAGVLLRGQESDRVTQGLGRTEAAIVQLVYSIERKRVLPRGGAVAAAIRATARPLPTAPPAPGLGAPPHTPGDV